LGEKKNEIPTDLCQVSYKIIQTENVIKLDCPILKKEFAVEEVSAQLVRKLANDASNYLGEDVNQAVITVPAYFNDSQRQATKDAGKIAGLEVLRIINEPTAAALSYGLDKKDNETILVFDLGGGTFDVSILEVGEGVFEVLATSGDTQLGGDDFDEKIVQWLIKEFKNQEGIDLTSEKQALQRLTEAAEKAKIELSTLTESHINLPFIFAAPDGPKHIEKNLTRENFEELCSDLIRRCQTPVELALKDAFIKSDKIDQSVLVGGSTRIPAVSTLLEKTLGKIPKNTVNPDEVVAIGAAVQAGVLGGEVKNILLLDVTPLSLGIETMGGLTTTLAPRNTVIPTTKYDTFSTVENNQTSVEIHVLQGERSLAKDNKSLGNFKLDGIDPAERGTPRIEVSFDIDASGILSVTAKDQETNKTQSLTISGASILSKEEVEQMIQEATTNEELDKKQNEQITLQNKAETVLYDLKKLINGNEQTEEEKSKLQDEIAKLEAALTNKDYESLRELTSKYVDSKVNSNETDFNKN